MIASLGGLGGRRWGRGARTPPPPPTPRREEGRNPLGKGTRFQLSPGVLGVPFHPAPTSPSPLLPPLLAPSPPQGRLSPPPIPWPGSPSDTASAKGHSKGKLSHRDPPPSSNPLPQKPKHHGDPHTGSATPPPYLQPPPPPSTADFGHPALSRAPIPTFGGASTPIAQTCCNLAPRSPRGATGAPSSPQPWWEPGAFKALPSTSSLIPQ